MFDSATGNTQAICMWHVDDVFVAGLPGDKMWGQEFEAIRQLYDWSDCQKLESAV